MENGVLLQGFHWYIKPEEKLWKQLQEKVKSYKEMGFQLFGYHLLIKALVASMIMVMVFMIFMIWENLIKKEVLKQNMEKSGLFSVYSSFSKSRN